MYELAHLTSWKLGDKVSLVVDKNCLSLQFTLHLTFQDQSTHVRTFLYFLPSHFESPFFCDITDERNMHSAVNVFTHQCSHDLLRYIQPTLYVTFLEEALKQHPILQERIHDIVMHE